MWKKCIPLCPTLVNNRETLFIEVRRERPWIPKSAKIHSSSLFCPSFANRFSTLVKTVLLSHGVGGRARLERVSPFIPLTLASHRVLETSLCLYWIVPMQPNVWPYLYANISCVKWCPETTDYIWRESEGVDCRRTMHPTFETMILHIKVVLHIWFHWDVLFFTINMALTPRGHHRSPFSWPWATPLVTKKSNGICPPFQFSKRWQHFSLSWWTKASIQIDKQ